jgi:hypothetical protein
MLAATHVRYSRLRYLAVRLAANWLRDRGDPELKGARVRSPDQGTLPLGIFPGLWTLLTVSPIGIRCFGCNKYNHVRLPASGAPLGRLLRGPQPVDFDSGNKLAKNGARQQVSLLAAVLQRFFDSHTYPLGHVFAFGTIQLPNAF